LRKSNPFANRTLKDFLEDSVAQDVVEYNLFQIVNHLIDMAQHIAVDEDYGYPQTAYEAGHLLLEKGVFGEVTWNFSGKWSVSEMWSAMIICTLNKEIVYSILTEGRKEIKALVGKMINKFL